jgi:hypothetical protein
MSIVVLQKKSRRYKVPVSGQGEYGFSINGTRRNIGNVGETNLARSTHRTRFRGNEPMGHGGCCGTYPRNIHNSGQGVLPGGSQVDNSWGGFNDSNVVKRSNQNTRALISQQLEFGRQTIQAAPGFSGISEDLSRCNCPKGGGGSFGGSRPIVKNPLWTNQSEYILYNIAAKNLGYCGEQSLGSTGEPLNISGNKCNSGIPGSNFIGTRRITNKCTITRPPTGAIDMSTYLRGLIYKKNCLPQDNNKVFLQNNTMPKPAWYNNDNCGLN